MRTQTRTRIEAGLATIAITLAGAAVAGCGGDAAAGGSATTLPQGSEPVELDPTEFTTEIDNPWMPMSPGSRWVYRDTDTTGAEQRVVVTVSKRTRTIANGVEARVVRDVVSEGGEPIEITDDWFAEDAAGNVWYLGERTAEYRNGRITSRAGSFEAGVDGAEAGIAMPADPEPGMAFRQEYYEGEAEDHGAIVSRGGERVEVSFGFYDNDVVMTRDLVPTEPRVQELKLYAPGVGMVLSVHTDGDGGRAELISYREGG